MTNEDIVLPRQLRLFLYIALGIASPIMGYLAVAHPDVIGPNETALYAGITTFIALLAGLNVKPKSQDATPDEGIEG